MEYMAYIPERMVYPMAIDATVQLGRDKSLGPRLPSFLAAIPDHMLHNGDHNLRVPLGIYNVAFSAVMSGFRAALSALANGSQEEIFKAYVGLLHQLSGFIDSGYHMMKCLYPKTAVKKPKKFAYQWIEVACPKVATEYYNSIKPYKDRLATVLNKVKHEHAVFTAVAMSTKYGSTAGYCIVAANEKGIIQPDPEVHPQFNGQHTAISYAWDLRYHIVYFYHVCNEIAKAMNNIIRDRHGSSLTYQPIETADSGGVIKMINLLPKVFSLMNTPKVFH